METVDIPALLREYESACANRETDARNQGTWDRLNKARTALVAGVETTRKSERYAWKNTLEIDAERMKFREALQSIADESFNDSAQIKARRALSAEGES